MTVALVALRLASVPWWLPFLAVYGLRVVGSAHTQKRAGDASTPRLVTPEVKSDAIRS